MKERNNLIIDVLLAFVAANLLYCLPEYVDRLITYYIIIFILLRQRRPNDYK
jgi:hypothetical protein